jgi:uncharacterized protein
MGQQLIGIFKGILFLVAFGYVAFLGFMFLFQRDLQYLPTRSEQDVASLKVEGLEKVAIKTPDGETLTAFFKPPKGAAPALIYLHGNGGNLMSRPLKIATYANSPFGVLAVSYRGYGDSTGTPTEAGLVTDARAAYDWLQERIPEKGNIVVVGESLGTGVAIQLAASRPIRALALEAPYADAVDIGAARYWYLPVRWLMQDQFHSSQFIGKVNVPLLVQHGTSDMVVPYKQGRALFELANEPKQFIEFPGEGHGIIGDDHVWHRELQFFGEVTNTPVAQ